NFKSHGRKIVWENQDSAAHTITSGTPNDGPDGFFDSGLINPREQFTITVKEYGEYNYFCMVHPWMKGTISVRWF
ncbi:MAG: PEFG-CTERM domain-containing protein, partial [Nitrosopumilus sp.]|nr:PEFG-CTERM domain-containing protein [Nitrosopumilus sp.]